MTNISCLLMAAGESKRMGRENKLLLPWESSSLVRRTRDEILKVSFKEVIIVTGHESELIEPEVRDKSVHIVHNEHYQTGLHSSIRAGLRFLHPDCEGFAVCLSDQPSFSSAHLEKLAQVFSVSQGPRIVFPTSQGRRGNPTFISKHFISEILQESDGDYGCAYLLKRHPQALIPVEVEDESILLDIDTPSQYQAMRAQL